MPGKKATPQKQVPAPSGKAARRRRRKARREAAQTLAVIPARQQASRESFGATLAHMMATPEAYPTPWRVPTSDMPATACIKTVDQFNAITPRVTGTKGFALTKGTLFFAVYGQPGRALHYGPIERTGYVSGQPYARGFFPPPSGPTDALSVVSNEYFILKNGASTLWPAGTTITRALNFNSITVLDNHEQKYRPIGVSRGRNFVWLNTEEIVQLSHYNAGTWGAPGYELSIDIVKWVGPSTAHHYVTTMTDWTNKYVTFTAPSCGYYSFTANVHVTTAVTVASTQLNMSIATHAASPMYYHLYYPEKITTTEVAECIRRTACTVCITNTTADIYRTGNIIAARMVNEMTDDGTNLSDAWSAGGASPGSEIGETSLAGLANKYSGRAAKGCFTYMDFENQNEAFSRGVTDAGCPVFDLDFTGFVNCISVSDPASDVQSNSYLITINMVTEFRTDNPLFTTSVPCGSIADLVEARRVNNSTAYFYENPLHMGDIWRQIKSAFQYARRAAVPLGMAASALFPELGPLVMPMAHALQL